MGFLLAVILLPAFSFGESPGDPLAGFDSFKPRVDQAHWSPVITTGFDALLHSYPLATTDTTETIAEYMVSAGIEGRSARRINHRWRLRAEASAGSELYRQQLEFQYTYLDQKRITRLRVDGKFYGRQYRQTTDYSLSSNNLEKRIDLRAYPWASAGTTLEMRAWHSALDYQNPSTLEVDTKDTGAGIFLRSRGLSRKIWSVGYRFSGRTYPDTTGIDRNVHRVEGDFDFHDDQGQGIRLYHKSGRRLIRDETLRPSAWAHYSDMNSLVAAGSGFVYLDLQSEIWQYDEETSTYFDSCRIKGVMGYRFGDILEPVWRLGLAAERLDAGDSPETYTQFGMRAGVESFGSDVSGSLQLEFGRRVYSQGDVALQDDPLDDILSEDLITFYSDFNYWEIWLMANWSINAHFSLDVMANYEPENHTEKNDDSSIGFGSVRLVWRP